MIKNKIFWKGFVIGIASLLLITSIYFFSGFFNISTGASHPIINILMEGIKDRSLSMHTGNIKFNVTKNDESLKKGAIEYMSSCVTCHGAPGYPGEDYAKYFEPLPPDLSDKDNLEDLSDKDLFWIIKNGIRMTGMPAFGKINSDEDIQNAVIFVKELQNLKKEEDFKKIYK